MYKDQKEMPSEHDNSQFVQIWRIGDKLWCDNYKWFGGMLYVFNETEDAYDEELEYKEGGLWRRKRDGGTYDDMRAREQHNNAVYIVLEK